MNELINSWSYLWLLIQMTARVIGLKISWLCADYLFVTIHFRITGTSRSKVNRGREKECEKRGELWQAWLHVHVIINFSLTSIVLFWFLFKYVLNFERWCCKHWQSNSFSSAVSPGFTKRSRHDFRFTIFLWFAEVTITQMKITCISLYMYLFS